MEKINKKKVSQLPEAKSIDGFYAFGTDKNDNSVKVPIELLKGNKGDTGEQGEKGDDGNSVAYKTIFNVSQYNNKYDYTDQATARNAVPTELRGLGQQITYKLGSGKWVTEQYIGSDVSGWKMEENWTDLTSIRMNTLGGALSYDLFLENSKADMTNLYIPIDMKWITGGGFSLVESAIGTDYTMTFTNTQYQMSNLIDVSSIKKIKFSAFVGTENGIAGFDADRKYVGFKISSSDLRVPKDSQVISQEYNIPDTVKYISISTKIAAINGLYIFISDGNSIESLVSHKYILDIIYKNHQKFKDNIKVSVSEGEWYIPIVTYTQGIVYSLAEQNDVINTAYQKSNNISVKNSSKLKISAFLGANNGIAGFNTAGEQIWKYSNTEAGTPKDAQVTDLIIGIPKGTSYITLSTRIAATNSISVFGTTGKESVDMTNQELYNLIKENSAVKENNRFVYFDRPAFASIYLAGTLPTDNSDTRTPTELEFNLQIDGKSVLNANCTLAIQGHGSSNYPKKGYTFDVLNASGKSLKLKFGNMIATDSFHLKAYATDRTHSRDVSNLRIWRDMAHQLDYPKNKINNNPFILSATTNEKELYIHDAQYFPDGFPIAIYLNQEFYGLYTLRLKKTRDNYAINNSNKNHIFLDSSTVGAYLKKAFNPTNWDVKSPKMLGYEEGGTIPDVDVLSTINRLFSFTSSLASKYTNHGDYIVLDHWLLWIIFSELTTNYDTSANGNNYNLLTWNGIHWSILPYDTDLTLGLDAWGGYIIRTGSKAMDINGDIWGTFKNVYKNEIKELYTKLRKSGFLTMKNLGNYYIGQTKNIPREIYQLDREKWALIWTNAEPSIEQILIYLNNRIEYLDTQWLA